ncbi:MAG: phosphatase PAP2 family protein [Proteobacteria bacterium]|nr:phosphatase PAP2 family protein [Pseudomonadota bacterium]
MKNPSAPYLALALLLGTGSALAAGGPLGIDHRLNMHDAGIWKRGTQNAVLGLAVTADIAAALYEGGDSRLGKTLWQSIDSTLLATAGSSAGKLLFRRERPGETSDPNKWFQSGKRYSFPSGEVSSLAGMVTPFVLEYGRDHPMVYALELLPAYDAIARVRTRGHWQTDVLAGWALGTAAGYYAHSRNTPFILSALPHGFMVGMKKNW